MMGRTHLAVGLLAGLLLFSFSDIHPFLFVALAAFGALLPDVDHENSKINRILPVTRWIPSFFPHRGFFHSVFPVIIIYGIFIFAGLPGLGVPLVAGYVSHIISDCLTRLGCNLLYPVSTFRIQGFVQTGGLMELLVFACVMLVSAALVLEHIAVFF